MTKKIAKKVCQYSHIFWMLTMLIIIESPLGPGVLSVLPKIEVMSNVAQIWFDNGFFSSRVPAIYHRNLLEKSVTIHHTSIFLSLKVRKSDWIAKLKNYIHFSPSTSKYIFVGLKLLDSMIARKMLTYVTFDLLVLATGTGLHKKHGAKRE